MKETFLMKLLNLSVQGSIAIGVILFVRLIMMRMQVPKRYAYLLWSIAFLRLICPFTFESVISIMPDQVAPVTTIVESMQSSTADTVHNREHQNADSAMNRIEASSIGVASEAYSVDPIQIVMYILTVVWGSGVVLLVFYSFITYVMLRRKLVSSVKGLDDIYWSDYIDAPFVFGLIKPHIYLPSNMDGEDTTYIISHEKVHMKRKDYVIKFLAHLIVILHWFNPVVWAAYVYMNKDMEMSCDERVMESFKKKEKRDIRKEYATLLLSLSVEKQPFLGAPLAFKEGDVKCRVKNIAGYKKPVFLVAVTAIVACVLLAVALLSNPVRTTTLKKAVPALLQVNEEKIGSIGIIMSGDEDQISQAYANQILTFMRKLEVEKKSKNIAVPMKESELRSAIRILFYKQDESNANYTVTIQGQYIWFRNGAEQSRAYTLVNPDKVEEFVKQIYGSMVEATPMEEQQENENGSDNKANEKEDTEEVVEVPVTTPVIDLSADAGADGVTLDYADKDIVIFHGYFGLFVYRLSDQQIIGAVDLKPIGCNFTQGDAYCEVFVSEDGAFVYLHPMNEDIQYTYEVATKKMTKSAYNLDGVTLFKGLEENLY